MSLCPSGPLSCRDQLPILTHDERYQSRRTLLLSAGTVLSIPLSGCSSPSELTRESESVSTADLWVKNLGDSPVVSDVVIRDVTHDGVVFWDPRRTRPMADRDDDGTEEIDVHSWEAPVQSPGDYAPRPGRRG